MYDLSLRFGVNLKEKLEVIFGCMMCGFLHGHSHLATQ